MLICEDIRTKSDILKTLEGVLGGILGSGLLLLSLLLAALLLWLLRVALPVPLSVSFLLLFLLGLFGLLLAHLSLLGLSCIKCKVLSFLGLYRFY